MIHRTSRATWSCILLAAALSAAGQLAAQEEIDANRRGDPTAPPRAARPAPKPAGAAPVGAHRAGVTRRPNPDARRVPGTNGSKQEAVQDEPGLPVELGPRGRCHFEVSAVPRMLMPGQGGTVKVVMVLEDDSVLASASDLQVVLLEEPGAGAQHLTIGSATVQPPTAATLASAFRGRDAYDDWALVEVPIAMSSSAPLGSKQSLALEFRFRLHEGSTGRLFGEYEHPLSIACEVGNSPNPALPLESKEVVSRPAVVAAGTGGPARVPAQSAERPVVEGAVPAQPVGEPRVSGDDAAPLLEPDREGDLPLLIFTGGLAVLGAVTLLLRRR